jgi:hypothetical protein
VRVFLSNPFGPMFLSITVHMSSLVLLVQEAHDQFHQNGGTKHSMYHVIGSSHDYPDS